MTDESPQSPTALKESDLNSSTLLSQNGLFPLVEPRSRSTGDLSVLKSVSSPSLSSSSLSTHESEISYSSNWTSLRYPSIGSVCPLRSGTNCGVRP